MIQYKYRNRFSCAVKPDVAAAALEEIRSANDGLNPRTVVDESRRKDAPLHPAFEWDDSVAGESFRVHQARILIRSVEVVRTNGDTTREPIFVHVETGRYERADVVITDEGMYSDALGQLMDKLRSSESAVNTLAKMYESVHGKRRTKRTRALASIRASIADAMSHADDLG